LLSIKKHEQVFLFGEYRNQSYDIFQIPKKSGGFRVIEAPNDRLKLIQLWIKENIIDKIRISSYAKGFKQNTCIYHNALPHTRKELVINIDLKDFFPSIEYRQVFRIFNYLGYTVEVSHLLSKLCTNTKNVLPQGAPTSPAISNVVCLKLDKRLSELAKKWHADYTRYADDITISGYKGLKSVFHLIEDIIIDEGFDINFRKLRMQYSFQKQEVTGLIVNNKVSAPKKLIKELENAIYFSKKFGVCGHMKYISCDKAFYKEHLFGIAYFVKMIELKKGEQYLKELSEIHWAY
jgi:retron-type reverse transcriptase